MAKGWRKPHVRQIVPARCTAYLLRMSFRVAYNGTTNPLVVPGSLRCQKVQAHIPVSIRCTVIKYPNRFSVAAVRGHIVEPDGDNYITVLIGPNGQVSAGVG